MKHSIHHFLELASTHAYLCGDNLSQFANELKAVQLVAVTCDNQTAGVGTYNQDGQRRTWTPAEGNYFGSFLLRIPTFALRPREVHCEPSHAGCLQSMSLVLAAGLAQTFSRVCGQPIKLKYPNDLRFGDLKVAGMFCEVPRTPQGYAYFVNGELLYEPNLLALPENAETIVSWHLGLNLRDPNVPGGGAMPLPEGIGLSRVRAIILQLLDEMAGMNYIPFLTRMENEVAQNTQLVHGLGQPVRAIYDDGSQEEATFVVLSIRRAGVCLSVGTKSRWIRPRTIVDLI